MTFRICVALLCLLGFGSLNAAETGYTYRDTILKAKPFTDAVTVTTLPAKTPVEVLVRKGAWMQVRQQDSAVQGWVRMLSVRLGSAEKKSSSGSLLSMIGIGNRARPQTSATVTTGVRGFSEEDLKQAKPDPEELKKMDGLAIGEDQARHFATQGNLASQTVSYFDEKGMPAEVNE